jgi:hypothetical protein
LSNYSCFTSKSLFCLDTYQLPNALLVSSAAVHKTVPIFCDRQLLSLLRSVPLAQRGLNNGSYNYSISVQQWLCSIVMVQCTLRRVSANYSAVAPARLQLGQVLAFSLCLIKRFPDL